MRLTAAPLALLSALAALASVTAPVAAQSNCQWYGATALKQQQQNEKLKCGFSGPEWNSDLGRHLQWCGSVPPNVWKSSAQKRDQMLAACASKSR
ncbi:MAG: hypothetical protein KDJ47_17610 [Hyphomicrobiaceae bacterium]|nr:hypothetical protein [Hyphomicrobiaceae bacterium]